LQEEVTNNNLPHGIFAMAERIDDGTCSRAQKAMLKQLSFVVSMGQRGDEKFVGKRNF